ncbi:MAG: LPS export ABC transporter ATP-binding protein [Lentisphaerae bacterium]|nr:LPS export ABC transporter ATP-binding protein [Lentisphaerota bacterium]
MLSGEKTMLLKATAIEKGYRGRPIVKKVDFEVGRGEIVGLLGPNGAGKTTTFYTVVGLVRADAGTIVFDGRDITHEPVYKRARLGIGYLAQEPSVFRKLTVEQNLLAILETMDLDAAGRRARADELLEDLGLTKVARQKAYTLSGGERRKLEIARSLVRKPLMLMLDEPFSGVDPLAVGDIQEIVRGLRDRGLGLLITDHNVRETLAVVDRAYLLYEGEVLREGPSDFLINDEMSKKLYLGESFKL